MVSLLPRCRVCATKGYGLSLLRQHPPSDAGTRDVFRETQVVSFRAVVVAFLSRPLLVDVKVR
jgi:hypothetical protein